MNGYDSDENDWNEWDSDQEGDYFNVPSRDIFSQTVFEEPQAFVKYALDNYKFDLVELFKSLKLDTYGRVRLINFLRKNVATTPNPTELYNLAFTTYHTWADNEELLLPVEVDDGLLQYAATLRQGFGGLSDDEWSDDEDTGKIVDPQVMQRRENEFLRNRVDELEDIVGKMSQALQNMITDTPSTVETTNPEADKSSVPSKLVVDDIKSNDDAYFGGYSAREIHEIMLRDRVRTETYRDSMLARAEDLFKGKVVLDVGCGTGILSMFAAKAGAKRVVGVDAADIIDKTREIVKTNGFDNIISLVKGKVEEISLPADVLTVDIIISEWMGYFLLYESMLPSVFFARDKWLRRATGVSLYETAVTAGVTYDPASVPSKTASPFAADTLLFPDVARMFISGVETRQHRAVTQDFWGSVYGFDMSCLVTPQDAIPNVSIDILYAKDACTITDKHGLSTFDLMVTDSSDLDFKSSMTLKIEKDDVLDAFVVWFDTIFNSAARREAMTNNTLDVNTDYAPVTDASLVLDTSYTVTPTHWKQTLFRLVNVLKVKVGDTVNVDLVATRRKDNHRHYDVQITYELLSENYSKPEGASPIMNTVWGEPNVKYCQNYALQ